MENINTRAHSNQNQNIWNKLDYIFVYFLFAFGGVTTFSSNSRFGQVFFIFLFLMFIIKKRVFDKEYYLILTFIGIIFAGQTYIFGDFNYLHLLVLFYTFFIPYGIIKLVGLKFTDYFVNITYVFAIISFLFLIPSYISPDFRIAVRNFAIWINLDPLKDVTENFIIYNYEPMVDGIIKNPGPFYEAGAFGTFLIVALLLNLIKTKSIFDIKNIVFIIAILTTFSTATYIAFFLLLFFYFTNKRAIWINVILAPALALIMYNIFSDVSFMKEKIATQFEASSRQGDDKIGRIQGGLVDLRELKESPVFGKGIMSTDDRSNNGLTDMALRYGPVGFILFFFLMILSLRIYCKANKYSTRFAVYAAIPIAAVLFGQVLYTKPIFLGLMMMFILYKGKNVQLYSLKTVVRKKTNMNYLKTIGH